MEEYDQRQLVNMLNQLAAYEVGKVDLAVLISNLESLLNALQSMPKSWVNKVRQEWGVLEEVYSVAIVREQSVESAENRRLVGQAIKKIRDFIDTALAEA